MTESDTRGVPSDGLTLTITSLVGDTAELALKGRFDVVESLGVREQLASEKLAPVRHLTIDLTEVSFVDSAGLAVLARARRDLMREGGSVTLVRPIANDAMRVFRLTQFDQIFTMIDRPQTDGS
ncbi:STAS domain-containing protein [Subtercola sp. PAMC28395]|uniref:STAS domain-containing protein n=1 Tax=Subtercola sp. PAMC28395 TaxID=2846775 RepID=UPI001C0C0468|nr:STAS domain-containing protein [Subtercola sp. PAMC28395]QWT24317.1 STAS domain-containing protein [Subtercola sp. PAMC28395]